MTGENFFKSLQHFKIHVNCSKEKPVLLTMDNHTSHLDYRAVQFAKENRIVFFTFPPHKIKWHVRYLMYISVKLFHSAWPIFDLQEEDKIGRSCVNGQKLLRSTGYLIFLLSFFFFFPFHSETVLLCIIPWAFQYVVFVDSTVSLQHTRADNRRVHFAGFS